MSLEVQRPGPYLAQCTTLRLGGQAMVQITASEPEDFADLPDVLEQLGLNAAVLGFGSNILAADGEIPLAVVRPNLREEMRVLAEDEKGALVLVQAGVRLPKLLTFAAGKGLAGLAGLMGIPGSVGGAVAMNAGSFGCDIATLLRRVWIFHPENGCVWLEPGQWSASYRRFRPMGAEGFFVILAAEIYLERGMPDSIRQDMAEVYQRKKASQPILEHSAGCVFKNPAHGVSAGLLLERAGMKEVKVGQMCFSKLHANFMINTGQGSSRDALTLIELGRDKVKAESGYELELEVRLWPWH